MARARRLQPEWVRALIAEHSEGKLLGVFAEPRINVLELNPALDTLK
jgi:K+-transporting ATPase ATPase C chain